MRSRFIKINLKKKKERKYFAFLRVPYLTYDFSFIKGSQF